MSTITLLTSAGTVRVEGEGLVIDIRDIPETPANPSAPQARQATAAGEVTSSASPATHSAPSKAETGRAGGPVCAPVNHSRGMNGPAKAGGAADEQSTSRGPVTLSDPAERPSDAIFGERFSHPTSNVTTISSQPAGSVGVPHSKPHKSGEVKVQPANLSDPRDPGPIPSWMDKRAKKDAA